MARLLLVGAAVRGRRNRHQREEMEEQLALQQAEINALKASQATGAAITVTAASAATKAPVMATPAVVVAAPAVAVAVPASSDSLSAGKKLLVKAYSIGDANDLEAMNKMRGTMDLVLQECKSALGAYQKSFELQKKAGRSNMAGMIMDGAAERMMQFKRDKEMQAALEPAEKASEKLIQAFSMIPPAVRAIYPDEMAHVGNVPIASLRVGRFGQDVVQGALFGDVGDAMNQIGAAKKLRENEKQLKICMETVSDQIKRIEIVIKLMERKIAELISTAKAAAAAPAMTAAPAYSAPAQVPYTAPAYSASYAAPVQAPYTAPAYSAPAPSAPYAVPAAYTAPVPPPRMAPTVVYLELLVDHNVDELSEAMHRHNIIRAMKGERVRLVQGTIENGLGAPYGDYIEIERTDGKTGKISRKVVRVITY